MDWLCDMDKAASRYSINMHWTREARRKHSAQATAELTAWWAGRQHTAGHREQFAWDGRASQSPRKPQGQVRLSQARRTLKTREPGWDKGAGGWATASHSRGTGNGLQGGKKGGRHELSPGGILVSLILKVRRLGWAGSQLPLVQRDLQTPG